MQIRLMANQQRKTVSYSAERRKGSGTSVFFDPRKRGMEKMAEEKEIYRYICYIFKTLFFLARREVALWQK